jgi:hypothetical protein
MSIQPDPIVTAVPVEERVVVTQPAVTQPAVVAPPAAVEHREVTSYGRRYAFDSVVVGIVGLALTLIGLVAATRAGFDGSMEDPVVQVLRFDHTVTLGIIEAALGICLLRCAVTTSRAGSTFFGLVLGVAAFVAAVQTESFDDSLAIESSFAWLLVLAAIVVVAASLLIPRMWTRTAHAEAVVR